MVDLIAIRVDEDVRVGIDHARHARRIVEIDDLGPCRRRVADRHDPVAFDHHDHVARDALGGPVDERATAQGADLVLGRGRRRQREARHAQQDGNGEGSLRLRDALNLHGDSCRLSGVPAC